MTFIIASMPRSRSAWLATLLDCSHDLLQRSTHFSPSLAPRLSTYGTVETGLGLFPEALAEYPDAKIAVILNDPLVVARSLRSINPDLGSDADRIAWMTLDGLREIAEKDNCVLTIKSEDLRCTSIVLDLCKRLEISSGKWMNSRLPRFMDLNIQVLPEQHKKHRTREFREALKRRFV